MSSPGDERFPNGGTASASFGESRFTLPDGRRLGYSEYGDPAGRPAFYFHGLPGSRLEAALGSAAAAGTGMRLIAIDRPGIGGSDDQPGRRLLDWPADVAHLADHLGSARFSVVGISAGGPYAAACAYVMPRRLDAVAIVSGIAPLENPALLKEMPWVSQVALRVARRSPGVLMCGSGPAWLLRMFPRATLWLVARLLGAPDRAVLARKAVRETMARSLAESLRQGARGCIPELTVLGRPWGFRLEEIDVEIGLWHGGEDPLGPPSHSRSLGASIRRASPHIVAGAGHYSLGIDHAAKIFQSLRPHS